MIFGKKSIAVGLLITLGSTAMAEEVEWKYFTNPSSEGRLAAGETGYKVCADPSWVRTAADKDKVALVPTRQCNYPTVPSEDEMFNCFGAGDVVAVNWTLAKAEGKTEAVLAAAANIGTGLLEVVIPESASSPPDYSAICP
jgi:hypothetical protein